MYISTKNDSNYQILMILDYQLLLFVQENI